MNEITHIHLGRQPYTISVAAHTELKAYLADIKAKVDDKEVVNEVELRMAELLTERGVIGEKVVLPEDIQYLKKQLGNPEDFSEDKDVSEASESERKTAKRLFRDTDNAILAGVAAGLANYLGLDTVIIRLLFVLLAIFGSGLGIVVYLVLWLVVPAAETASEKLQMHGKPVTLDALRASVDKADVQGAAQRLNSKLMPIINSAFRLLVKLIGLSFILAGLGALVGVAAVKLYMLLHGNKLFQENIFPVGLREQWLLGIVMLIVVLVATFLFLTGIAAFQRKWPVRGWITGILAGMLVVGSAASIVLAADAAPRVRERYEALLHTTAVQNIQPFNRVVTSGDIDVAYISSPNYAVNMHYLDNPDLSKIQVRVTDNTLYIDSTALDASNHCTMLCLFPRYNMTVQVYAPNVDQFITPPKTDIFYPAPPVLN